MVNSSFGVEMIKGDDRCGEKGVGEERLVRKKELAISSRMSVLLRRIIFEVRPVRFDRHRKKK